MKNASSLKSLPTQDPSSSTTREHFNLFSWQLWMPSIVPEWLMLGATEEPVMVGFWHSPPLVKHLALALSSCLLTCHYKELSTKDPSHMSLWKNLVRPFPWCNLTRERPVFDYSLSWAWLVVDNGWDSFVLVEGVALKSILRFHRTLPTRNKLPSKFCYIYHHISALKWYTCGCAHSSIIHIYKLLWKNM